MFPATSPVPGASQAQGAPPQQAAAGKGSGKKLAIGALVVVGGIVAIAVIASRGGNHIDSNELVLEQLEGSRDLICACSDEPCRREVLERMDRFSKDNPGNGKKMSAEQSKKMDAIFADIDKCMGVPSASGRQARDEAAWTKFRDEMCACHDRACAKRVHDEVEKYVDSHASEPDVPATKKLVALVKENGKCFEAAVAGGGGEAKPTEEDESVDDDVMIQELGNLKDKMCDCADKACAREVADGIQDWGKQYKARFDQRPADVRRQAHSIIEAQNKCFDKIMGK